MKKTFKQEVKEHLIAAFWFFIALGGGILVLGMGGAWLVGNIR